jgi:hypothetical protein
MAFMTTSGPQFLSGFSRKPDRFISIANSAVHLLHGLHDVVAIQNPSMRLQLYTQFESKGISPDRGGGGVPVSLQNFDYIHQYYLRLNCFLIQKQPSVKSI